MNCDGRKDYKSIRISKLVTSVAVARGHVDFNGLKNFSCASHFVIFSCVYVKVIHIDQNSFEMWRVGTKYCRLTNLVYFVLTKNTKCIIV